MLHRPGADRPHRRPRIMKKRRESPDSARAEELSNRWRFFDTYLAPQFSTLLRQSFLTPVAANVRSDAFEPASRPNAVASDHWADQALRHFSRQRFRRHRHLAGANPRAARRERRRQVDAGQNYLWLDSAERRRNV